MLNDKKRKQYDEMAVMITRGELGYKAAVKCKLSKSPTKCYGKTPESLQ